jgi:hypothetical protein
MEINSRAVLLACLSALRLPAGERTSDHVMQLAHLRTVLRNEGIPPLLFMTTRLYSKRLRGWQRPAVSGWLTPLICVNAMPNSSTLLR